MVRALRGGVWPHLAKGFKLSNAPLFVEEVREITALCLNPPDRALVIRADDKTQIQALDGTQPVLPMNLGYAEGYTHDHIRHGTTTLFAALDVATGKVIVQRRKRHRHQEWRAFLRLIEREIPKELDIRLICDNCSAHDHAKVQACIAKRKRTPLHPDPRLLAEPGRAPVWHAQPARHQTFHVPQSDGSEAAHPGFHRDVQRDRNALRLGGDCRFDLREAGAIMEEERSLARGGTGPIGRPEGLARGQSPTTVCGWNESRCRMATAAWRMAAATPIGASGTDQDGDRQGSERDVQSTVQPRAVQHGW